MILGILAGLAVLFALIVIGALVFLFARGSDGSEVSVTEASVVRIEPAEPTGPSLDTDPFTNSEVLNISWDENPSACDENSKRWFSADVDNVTNDELGLRMRILDPSGVFVHQSHVYVAPASATTEVHLGGIPAGESTVQIINEADGQAIAQIPMTFDAC